MMRGTKVLLDQVVFTDYGQLDLCWSSDGFDGDFDRVFAGQVNGVAGAAHPGALYLNLGRRSSGSHVRVELCDAAPVDGEPWEDVVEVSVTVAVDEPGSRPAWVTWASEDSGSLDLPDGAYRVRVSARGRDEGDADELSEDVLDFYLVQFWPGADRPDEIVRTTSKNAAYWHRAVGSRR